MYNVATIAYRLGKYQQRRYEMKLFKVVTLLFLLALFASACNNATSTQQAEVKSPTPVQTFSPIPEMTELRTLYTLIRDGRAHREIIDYDEGDGKYLRAKIRHSGGIDEIGFYPEVPTEAYGNQTVSGRPSQFTITHYDHKGVPQWELRDNGMNKTVDFGRNFSPPENRYVSKEMGDDEGEKYRVDWHSKCDATISKLTELLK